LWCNTNSLIIIALKEPNTPNIDVNIPTEKSSEIIVNLDINRIAIITINRDSGNYGNILVLEYDANKKTFILVSRFNYRELK